MKDEDPMFEGGEDFNDENEDMQSRNIKLSLFDLSFN